MHVLVYDPILKLPRRCWPTVYGSPRSPFVFPSTRKTTAIRDWGGEIDIANKEGNIVYIGLDQSSKHLQVVEGKEKRKENHKYRASSIERLNP